MQVITAPDAARLLRSGDSVVISGSGGGHGIPEAVLQAIETRFFSEGEPRDLCLIHVVGLGDRAGKGTARFAREGMVRRSLGIRRETNESTPHAAHASSSWPGGPSPPGLTRWLARPSTSLMPARREDVDGRSDPRVKPEDGHDDEGATVAPLAAFIPQRIFTNALVDYVVADAAQRQTYATEYSPGYSGDRIAAVGLELIEIARGIDVERDVLAQMDLRPRIAPDLRRIDARLFHPEPMGLAADARRDA